MTPSQNTPVVEADREAARYAALGETSAVGKSPTGANDMSSEAYVFAEEKRHWTARDRLEENRGLFDEMRKLWRYLDGENAYRGDDADQSVVDEAIAYCEHLKTEIAAVIPAPEPSNEYQKLVEAVAGAVLAEWNDERPCHDKCANETAKHCACAKDTAEAALSALSVSETAGRAQLKLSHAGDDGWQDIATAPKDHGRYLFITKKGTQRVDSFHPDQFSNSRHRWHERPVDPYVAWRPLPTPPAGVGDNG